MIIDLETHFATEAWVDALSRNEGYPRLRRDTQTGMTFIHLFPDGILPLIPAVMEKLLDVGPGRVAALDAAGIDVAVLSHMGAETLAPPAGTRLARTSNDALAEAISRYPDRFQGFASLPVRDVDEAVKELERAVKDLGLKGWMTLSNYGDSYLDEKRYWPILAKAEELDAPIYVHPIIPMISELRTYGMALAGASFGFGAEASLVMMRLIVSGVFDVFPRLRIILGHLGEGFPFMMNRVDRPFLQGHIPPNPKAPPLRELPSVYLRRNMVAVTSGNYSADAFLCTKNALGVEGMAVGTDYPFEDMNECVEFLDRQPLSDDERHRVYEGTAASLGFAPR